MVLSAVQPPSTYTETDWDWYVEQIASIETIAGVLAKAGAPAGARMLDVGCGFGFGLDIGARVFDWSGIGLDPSIAADRGRAELGLDIRPGTLDDAFAPDERFDVIFASEVLEHVPDPRDFLRAVRRRLTDPGVFLMTTPDGAVVHEGTSITTLFPVLSVGAHEFLVDAPGLERLLRDAGFEVAIWQLGPSLGAVAALTPEALHAARPDAQADLSTLARYCDERARSAPSGSALELGMAARHLKLTTHIAEYRRAKDGLARLGSALEARYGITLEPDAVAALADPPTVLVPIHYYIGMLTLTDAQDPVRAARHLAAAAAVAKSYFDLHGGYHDPETPLIESLALAHRAVALSRFDPDAVPAALDDLDRALARGAGSAAVVAEPRALALSEAARGKQQRRARQVLRKVRRHARWLAHPSARSRASRG